MERDDLEIGPDDSGHGASTGVNVISVKDLPFSRSGTGQDSMEVKVVGGGRGEGRVRGRASQSLVQV